MQDYHLLHTWSKGACSSIYLLLSLTSLPRCTGEGVAQTPKAPRFISPEAHAKALTTPQGKAMTTPRQPGKAAPAAVPQSNVSKDASVIPCTPAGAYEDISQDAKSNLCTPLLSGKDLLAPAPKHRAISLYTCFILEPELSD